MCRTAAVAGLSGAARDDRQGARDPFPEGGSWSPESGSFRLPIGREAFAMTWYDGMVLRLEQADRGTT
jgi:hypothetical protein